VATAVGGAPDLIAPGENGLLVRPGDREALTRGILDLFANAECRGTLGQAARERVVTKYALEHVADCLRQLYERVVTRQDLHDHA
jgi:glycosyltransferase involved in cell wall biosynthesis